MFYACVSRKGVVRAYGRKEGSDGVVLSAVAASGGIGGARCENLCRGRESLKSF